MTPRIIPFPLANDLLWILPLFGEEKPELATRLDEWSLQQFLLTRGREGRVSDYDSRIPRARTVHDLLGFAVD